MAGDWIKWVKGLAKRPEVLHMAHLLGKSRHEVAGLLCEFWEWADENVDVPILSASEADACPGYVRLPSASSTLVDSLSGADGFAEAMTAVGWLIVRDGALVFPKFGRHNGKSAKRRALDAERKRTCRDRDESGVTNYAGLLSAFDADKKRTREEKRREEKNKEENPPPPFVGNDVTGGDSRSMDQSVRPPPKKEKIELIYQAYPRKVAKDAALKAIEKSLDRVSFEVLLSAVEEYARCRKRPGNDMALTPHPATWFNAGRWQDDREEWMRLDSDFGAKSDGARRQNETLADFGDLDRFANIPVERVADGNSDGVE